MFQETFRSPCLQRLRMNIAPFDFFTQAVIVFVAAAVA